MSERRTKWQSTNAPYAITSTARKTEILLTEFCRVLLLKICPQTGSVRNSVMRRAQNLGLINILRPVVAVPNHHTIEVYRVFWLPILSCTSAPEVSAGGQQNLPCQNAGRFTVISVHTTMMRCILFLHI